MSKRYLGRWRVVSMEVGQEKGQEGMRGGERKTTNKLTVDYPSPWHAVAEHASCKMGMKMRSIDLFTLRQNGRKTLQWNTQPSTRAALGPASSFEPTNCRWGDGGRKELRPTKARCPTGIYLLLNVFLTMTLPTCMNNRFKHTKHTSQITYSNAEVIWGYCWIKGVDWRLVENCWCNCFNLGD